MHLWWEWPAIPSNGLSGGILVLWKHSLGNVTRVAISRHALHLVITSRDCTWILSIIYNSQVLSDQTHLWHSLAGISTLNFPSHHGDFNGITSLKEHRGGIFFPYYASKAGAFSNFIFDNNLLDLGFSGSIFTWCNGQVGLARCWARLDRFSI